MMGFRFQDPLWLLLLIPLAVAGLWMLRRRRQRRGFVFQRGTSQESAGHFGAASKTIAARWFFWPDWGFWSSLLARPQHGKEEFRIRAEGIAIEMVVDRSGSMRGHGFRA